jgi:hypothetical protein
VTVDVPGRPYNLATLQPLPLGPGDRPETYPATYDVSADGQRFLMNAIVEEAPVPRVAVVVNWEAELKK